MKKNKLILGSLAALLIAGTIGTTFALFTRADDAATLTIGAHTDTDLVYAVSDISAATEKIQAGRTVTYPFTIGATLGTDSTYTQSRAVGNLKVKIESESQVLMENLTAKVAVAYDETTTWICSDGKDERTLNDAVLLEDGKTYEKTNTNPMWAYLVLGSTRSVTLDLSLPADLSDANVIAIAEAEYTVSVYLDNYDGYGFAYVVGSMTGWQETDAYMMVPMYTTDTFEWQWEGQLSGPVEFKAKNGDTWSNGDSGNTVLTEGQTTNGLWWKDGAADNVSTNIS